MLSVDVVVTTYNSEKTIRRTLDSILHNDYLKFRIIISDDASSDDTVSILNEYLEQYGNIQVLTSEVNLGILMNCNKVIAESYQSDVVMFCGHDDVFYKQKISRCVDAFLKDEKVSLVYHDVDVVYADGKRIKYSQTQVPRESGAKDYLLYGVFSTAPSVCVKSSILCDVKFKSEVDRASDYIMMYEVAKRGKIKYISEVLGEYHRHDSNLSSQIKSSDDFDSIIASIYVMKNYPEDTFAALIALNRSMIKLLLKRKKYLAFYYISPLYTTFWHLLSKLGKKII